MVFCWASWRENGAGGRGYSGVVGWPACTVGLRVHGLAFVADLHCDSYPGSANRGQAMTQTAIVIVPRIARPVGCHVSAASLTRTDDVKSLSEADIGCAST
jgi:hypothetical protein